MAGGEPGHVLRIELGLFLFLGLTLRLHFLHHRNPRRAHRLEGDRAPSARRALVYSRREYLAAVDEQLALKAKPGGIKEKDSRKIQSDRKLCHLQKT